MRLMVTVPVVRASRRIQVITSLHQSHIPIAAQNVISLAMDEDEP